MCDRELAPVLVKYAQEVRDRLLRDEPLGEDLVDATLRVFVFTGDTRSVLAIVNWYRRGWHAALDGWEDALTEKLHAHAG